MSLTYSNNNRLAKYNPFGYRGYYYDIESGFYYLNSRYYDPQIKRFINADSIIGANGGIVGYNLYAYCNNNPVVFIDPAGTKVVINMSSDFYRKIENIESIDNRQHVIVSSGHEIPPRPYTGEPNSKYDSLNGDWRKYNEDGYPSQDYDHDDHSDPNNHPHDENGGHYHDWESRTKRGKPHLATAFGFATIIISGAAIFFLAADDITVIGVADDALLVPSIALLTQGFQAVFE